MNQIQLQAQSSTHASPRDNSPWWQLIREAIAEKASGLRIDIKANSHSIFFQCNGLLLNQPPVDANQLAAVVGYIKAHANIDPRSSRGQTGRFSRQVLDRQFDFQFATTPTADGEVLVMHIVDQTLPMLN